MTRMSLAGLKIRYDFCAQIQNNNKPFFCEFEHLNFLGTEKSAKHYNSLQNLRDLTNFFVCLLFGMQFSL